MPPAPNRPAATAPTPLRPVPAPTSPPLPDGAIWEEPKINRTGPKPISAELAAALKAHPGKWARIGTSGYSSGPGSGAKSILKQLGDGWEWKGGKIADKQYGLWIRYNPAKGS